MSAYAVAEATVLANAPDFAALKAIRDAEDPALLANHEHLRRRVEEESWLSSLVLLQLAYDQLVANGNDDDA